MQAGKAGIRLELGSDSAQNPGLPMLAQLRSRIQKAASCPHPGSPDKSGAAPSFTASARNASSRCISAIRPTGAIATPTSSPRP